MAVSDPKRKELASTCQHYGTKGQKDKNMAKRAAHCRKGDHAKAKRIYFKAAIKVDSVGLPMICNQQDNFNFYGTHDKVAGHKWASTIYTEEKPMHKSKGKYGRVMGKSRSSFNNNERT